MEENKKYEFPIGSFVIIAILFVAYIAGLFFLVSVMPGSVKTSDKLAAIFMPLAVLVYVVYVFFQYTKFKNNQIDTKKMRFAIVGGFFSMVIINFIGCLSIAMI